MRIGNPCNNEEWIRMFSCIIGLSLIIGITTPTAGTEMIDLNAPINCDDDGVI
jgi:hypothetical protein